MADAPAHPDGNFDAASRAVANVIAAAGAPGALIASAISAIVSPPPPRERRPALDEARRRWRYARIVA